jgi:hypothetical protein
MDRPDLEGEAGMSIKHVWTSAVFMIVLAGGSASAQLPTDLSYLQPPRSPVTPDQPTYLKPTGPAPTPLPDGVTPSTQQNQPVLGEPPTTFDGYTVMNYPACLWPVGGNGPIGYDVYVRAGLNTLVGGGALKQSLETGGQFQGGGRSLFYNVDGSSAWTIDVGLTFSYNNGHDGQLFTPNSNTLHTTYTVRDLIRTSVGVGLGKDWFCYGPGYVGGSPNWNLVYGFAAGGRWGTSHVNLNEVGVLDGYARNQATFGEYFAAAHVDLQVPMGWWMFFAGARVEFSYTSLNVLPGTDSNLFNLSILLNAGFRF